LVEQRFCKPWVRGSSPLSGLVVRRLRFAIAVARRDPRLLADYARLWVGARRGVAESGWSPPESQVVSFEEAAGVSPVPALATGSRGSEWDSMDADATLGQLACALVRNLRPLTVIETGVARGITSSYVLAALAENDSGELHSIDLPPPRMVDAGLVGAAIPEEMKARWHYHWGSARRLLPSVLADAASPRLFIHDSDHSYRHMRWEVEAACAALEPGDVILCDDAHFHSGFADAARAVGAEPLFLRQRRDSRGLIGMLTL
jgi:predicted O-methyltransferase YrrM